MKKSYYKWIAISFIIIIVGLSLYSFNKCCQSFLTITIYDSISLILTIIISIYLAKYFSDEQRIISYIEKSVFRLQEIVEKKEFYYFELTMKRDDVRTRVAINTRNLSRIIHILDYYKNDFKFEDDLKYIAEQAKDYKEFISDNINNIKLLSKSYNVLSRYAENINDKCFIILTKLYKS